MKSAGRARVLGVLAALGAIGGATPAAGQFEVGLGLGVADTWQNAVAMVSTLTWNGPAPGSFAFALRGFVDAELAVPDLKEGLAYGPDSQNIVDEYGVPQRPEGSTLWQERGWDTHAAAYATLGWWRVHLGLGYAYNGLDGTWAESAVVVVYVTRRTEVDVEFLENPGSATAEPRWRLRLSMGFWRLP